MQSMSRRGATFLLAQPLVSVLVAVFNHAEFVAGCLDSIRDEDYESLELIIVDDGSQDSSLKIAQDWGRRHRHRFIRVVIETQANQGICKTFNRLVTEFPDSPFMQEARRELDTLNKT